MDTIQSISPGMVLTIEPGVYIREEGLDQIGIRIEDDILITGDGNIVLSRYASKEMEDIEQLMK